MPFSGTTSTRLVKPEGPWKPAYLVRFPEDVWSKLESASSSSDGISISIDGDMRLDLPGLDPITLKVQQSGTPSEIYSFSSGPPDSLTPYAIAESRLSIPFSSASTSRAADKLKAQNEANDRKRKGRSVIVLEHEGPVARAVVDKSSTSVGMTRVLSSPYPTHGSSPGGPIIPLKTRVVQLLALGPQSVQEIVSRVGMHESEVMRVVKVVGKETSPGQYTLQPSKYHQVKIAQWKYTHDEKLRVIQFAKDAFDELGLPPDADERADLDRKESDVMTGRSSSASEYAEAAGEQQDAVAATVPAAKAASPKKKDKAGLSLIGKQKAKFAAEKRASSLPNVRNEATASPRLGGDDKPTQRVSPPKKDDSNAKPASLSSSSLSSSALTKRKLERDKGQETDGGEQKTKRAYSPPESRLSDETRGRNRDPVVKTHAAKPPSKPIRDFKKKLKASRDYSSSEASDDELAAPAAKQASSRTFQHKQPPSELMLNGNGTNANTSSTSNGSKDAKEKDDRPDPETLRERYEELFPAYELLSKKLAKIHQDAEAEEEGQVVEVDAKELAKMVARWEKWHAELKQIRGWFGAA